MKLLNNELKNDIILFFFTKFNKNIASCIKSSILVRQQNR